jgi:hypothetical protein
MYTRHDNGDRTAPRTEGYNNDGWGSCGIWVALHDLPDPENGCLIVAVDSHLKGTLPGADYSSDRGTDKQLEDDSPVSFVFFFSVENVHWIRIAMAENARRYDTRIRSTHPPVRASGHIL